MGMTTAEGFAKITAVHATELPSITAPGGFKNLTGTGAHTSLTGYAVVVQEDTVFTVFTVDGVVQLANYGLNAVTVKAGAYLPCPKGDTITAITMSSGSCVIYML
jgi:hypothetical protein